MKSKVEIQNQINGIIQKIYHSVKISQNPNIKILTDNDGEAVKLCSTLLEYVPEFKEDKNFTIWGVNGTENPYGYFGVFGNFLLERMRNISEIDTVIERSFDFINDTYSNTNSEYVKTMLGTEVIEGLNSDQRTISVAKEYLKGEALGVFEKGTYHIVKVLNTLQNLSQILKNENLSSRDFNVLQTLVSNAQKEVDEIPN